MFRSKIGLFVVAFLVVGMVLLGTGVGVGLMTGRATGATAGQTLPTTSLQSVVQSLLRVSAPAQPIVPPQANEATLALPTVAPSAAPVTINIQPGADTESQVLEAIYQKVNPSVVEVFNLQSSSNSQTSQPVPQGLGSGFVWDKQGHIVTNDHVVSGADALQVTFPDGTTVDAKLVGTDPNGDIAVIQVDPTLVNLVPIEQGNIADVKVGEQAIAIGNPFGFGGTMTKGIVSAMGRTIPAVTGFNIPEAIQTDAAINPGNSGGPLLNEKGQIIGVNDQIQSSSGSNSGVGFSIPINLVQRIVPSLIKTGKYAHPYLGIEGGTMSPAWAKALDLPATAKGAYVMGVVRGGPAAQGGLQAGSQDTSVLLGTDNFGRGAYLQSGGDLITAVDGHSITKMDDLLIYLEENTSPGQTVHLTVMQAGGKEQTLTVKLGQRPEQAPSLNSNGQ